MARLLDRLREAIRVRQYSLATEQNYTRWVQRFILFHGKQHPDQMGKAEIEAFLTYLAVRRGFRLRRRIRLCRRFCFSTAKSSTSICPGWMRSFGPNRGVGCPWS